MEKVRKPSREWSGGKSILSVNDKMEYVSVTDLPPLGKNVGKYTQKADESTFQNERKNENLKSIIKQSFRETEKDSPGCKCGPDFYGAVLGPTADEAILKGIRTIISICQKFMTCDESEEEEKEEDIKTVTIIESKSAVEIISDIIEAIGLPKKLASQIVQTSFAELEEKKPSLASKILQTSTPKMVSQILQTLGFTPEMASEIVQTSLLNARSGMMQTSPPPSVTSVNVQTSDLEEAAQDSIHSNREKSSNILNKPSTNSQSRKSMVSIKQPSEAPFESVKSEVKVTDETDEKKIKMCVRCKCVLEDECSEELIDTSSHSVAERIRQNEQIINAKSPLRIRICKCSEYSSTVPIIGRRSRTCHELIDDSRTRKCICRSRIKPAKTTCHAKGDTCCPRDCCDCGSRSRY